MARLQNETPMTIGFWRTNGEGTLILEYPVVSRDGDSQRRAVDGLIIFDGKFRQCAVRDAPSLAGRRVMVVQTKAYRTDAAVVGQAVFSPILLRQQDPAVGVVESILLSPQAEPAFADLLERHGVQQVTVPGPPTKVKPIALARVEDLYLTKLHHRLGGEMLVGVDLGPAGAKRPFFCELTR